jgi:hypothetical protein
VLLVVIDRMIYRIGLPLLRWRCPSCLRTFTDYPFFAMPAKHYALPEIQRFVRKHVHNGGTSYRKGVTELSMPLFYADSSLAAPESGDEESACESVPALSHTTLYRWMIFLSVKPAP